MNVRLPVPWGKKQTMVAAYRVERGSFIVEKPREWSPLTLADTGGISNFDVDPDGTRVLALLPATVEDRQSVDHVTMILNFADEVRRRLTPESK